MHRIMILRMPNVTMRSLYHSHHAILLVLAGLVSLSSVQGAFKFPDKYNLLRTGVFTPEHSFHRRQYQSAITGFLRREPRSAKHLAAAKLKVHGDMIMQDSYSPPEVLREFCEDILDLHINTILYMSNTDLEGAHTASGQYVMQVSNFLGIPVIAWNGDNSGFFQPTAESIILQMAPSIEHQCRAMLSLLMRYGWYSFSVVTGSMAGEVHFVNNVRELADEYGDDFEIMTVISIPRPDPNVISEQLDGLIKAETRVILLYASKKEAEIILDIARNKKLTGEGYVWIVSQSIVGDMQQSQQSGFGASIEFPVGLIGIYFDIDLKAMTQAIEDGMKVWLKGMDAFVADHGNSSTFTNETLRTNLDCTNNTKMFWPNGRLLYDYLRNVSIQDGDRIIEFNDDGIITDTHMKIVNFNPELKWEEIGSWNRREGLTINDITWPGDKPSPPEGRPDRFQLKVVTLKENPYVIYSDPDPKTGSCPVQAAPCRIAPENMTKGVLNATADASLYQCCSGLCIDLLKILAEKMKFQFDLFQVEDAAFGGFNKETGEWNGLIRSLMDGKADMSMASLSITEERNQQIDFSVPFLETGITIIVAVRDGVISPTAFLEPFDILSWIFILLMCIHVVAVTVFLFEWLSPGGYDLQKLPPREPYDYPSWCLILVFSVHASGAAIFIFEWLSPSGLDRGNKPIRGKLEDMPGISDDPEHRFSLFRSFWLIWAMLFGAAVNTDNPRGVSSRFMANIWALFAVVFTASYTANLAAFMITKEDYDRLSGIQDWRLMNPYAHKPPFKFATVPHGSTEANLRKNYPDMYRYMKSYNRSTVTEGVRAVKDHEINAFIYDATVLEYLAGHDDGCKLRTVGNWYAMTGYGLGFPRGSKWLEKVNKHLIELQHNGEMERLQKFWLAGACSQRTEEGESSMPLGILNFTSAFILLAGGMLLGGLLLLLEHIYFKFFRHRLRKWDKCGCCGLVSLSMGKSLTFEQSVREAIDMQRHFKCRNPMCETQMWKVKHELDLALLKIERLQKHLGDNGINPEKRAVWKDNRQPCPPQTLGPPPMIGWNVTPDPPAGGVNEWSDNVDTMPYPPLQKTPYQTSVGPPPPPIGWNVNPDLPPDGSNWVGNVDTYPPVDTMPPPPNYGTATAGGRNSQVFEPHVAQFPTNKKGSKSLPSSPVKQKPIPQWRYDSPPYPLYSEKSNNAANMKRATSYSNTHSANGSPVGGSGRRTRKHRGNVYTGVDDEPLEKETVL